MQSFKATESTVPPERGLYGVTVYALAEVIFVPAIIAILAAILLTHFADVGRVGAYNGDKSLFKNSLVCAVVFPGNGAETGRKVVYNSVVLDILLR